MMTPLRSEALLLRPRFLCVSCMMVGYIQAGDGARYIVAMDAALAEQETPPLPKLPSNAEFVRPPSCFEMGVVGWLLYTSGRVDIADYRLSNASKGNASGGLWSYEQPGFVS